MSYVDKSTPELFEILFSGEYEDPKGELLEQGPSAALRELKERKDAAEFAKHFLSSVVATQRARSLDVLARFGAHRERAVPFLKDPEPAVVESAVYALGTWHGNPAHPALLDAKDHPSPDVRLGVARGLVSSDLPETPSVLTQLMKDSDDEVRNWSTFTLGQQLQYDSIEMREALRECLSDAVRAVRDEAIWGLARRRDSQGLRWLLYRLESGSWSRGDEDTANDVLGLRNADPEDLCDGLRQLLG